MTPHLTASTIAALLEARLPASDADAAMFHMRDCDECRALYVDAACALRELDEQDRRQLAVETVGE